VSELRTLNFSDLEKILESGSRDDLDSWCAKHNLEIRNGSIYPRDKKEVEDTIEYWDKIQLVRKISLNSLYGAILNPHCRFFDKRIGQSTTLTGRSIARHMDAYVNECITGQYDHAGDAIIYGDTDSVDKHSIIKTSTGDLTVERLFHAGTEFWKVDGKEYSRNPSIKIAHYSKNSLTQVNYNYVYRHKVSKKRYLIKTNNGKEVIVTEDHSVMILDTDGKLVEKKPSELTTGDIVVTIA
jgi:DNA polymerase elongation subunit (family B)